MQHYRPDYELNSLALLRVDCEPPPATVATKPSLASWLWQKLSLCKTESLPSPNTSAHRETTRLLQWLRTRNVWILPEPKEKEEGQPKTQRVVGTNEARRSQFQRFLLAVERINVLDGRDDTEALQRTLTEQLLHPYGMGSSCFPHPQQSLPMLRTLDLSGCSYKTLTTDMVELLPSTHGPTLRGLFLPPFSQVSQRALERFSSLEALDVTGNRHVTSVGFCSATLRELYATQCVNLNDDGLRNATLLEVLLVGHCHQVTTVEPFALRLRRLDASDSCGIPTDALAQCRRLLVLDVHNNPRLGICLLPFPARLRELHVGQASIVTDDHLACLGASLVSLHVEGNHRIRTVAPFGASLRELYASESAVTDEGLTTAVHLVTLFANDNRRIQSLVPFAGSLRMLSITGKSGITDASFLAAFGDSRHPKHTSCDTTTTQLMILDASKNMALTNVGVSRVASSLRHLCVQHRSGFQLPLVVDDVVVSSHCSSASSFSPASSTSIAATATVPPALPQPRADAKGCAPPPPPPSPTVSWNLLRLDCEWNPRIQTLAPFEHSLEAAFVHGKTCGVGAAALARAKRVRIVKVNGNRNVVPEVDLVALGFVKKNEVVWAREIDHGTPSFLRTLLFSTQRHPSVGKKQSDEFSWATMLEARWWREEGALLIVSAGGAGLLAALLVDRWSATLGTEWFRRRTAALKN